MVGKKYSRILYHFRPIFLLTENTYAFRTTISAQYFLVRHTHAFFTTFLVILHMVQNTHSFFAIFLWYENNAKNGRKSSRFCPNDDQLLWTSQSLNDIQRTKVIWQNTISSQNFWKLTVSSREKPFERWSREQSRAYSELSYELVSKILFKRLCANYQFRTVLFSIESFDSWLRLLGKEAKQSVERRSREPAEHIHSYLLNLDWQSCYH